MAKLTNGELAITLGASTRGFYLEGMVGVVNDYRDVDGGEYLVKFPHREKRVWTSAENLDVFRTMADGDTIIAIIDSAKGLYKAGMVGVVHGYRSVDGGEYLIKFDDKEKITWVKKENIQKLTRFESDTCGACNACDEQDSHSLRAIVLSDKYIGEFLSAGDVVDILDEGFGYYTIDNGFYGKVSVEKQDVFVLDTDEIYIHVLDLRRLRSLGFEFDSKSNLCLNGNVYIPYNMIDMIDKSFKVFIDEDNEIVFNYKGEEFVIEDYEIVNGLIEFRK